MSIVHFPGKWFTQKIACECRMRLAKKQEMDGSFVWWRDDDHLSSRRRHLSRGVIINVIGAGSWCEHGHRRTRRAPGTRFQEAAEVFSQRWQQKVNLAIDAWVMVGKRWRVEVNRSGTGYCFERFLCCGLNLHEKMRAFMKVTKHTLCKYCKKACPN